MGLSESVDSIISCRIELFGGMRVTIGDQTVHVPRERKAADLLAYLAYYPHIRHPRERLQDILWPDAANSKENLNLAVSRLGKCLEPDGSVKHGIYLFSDRSVIALRPENVKTDIAEFEDWLKQAHATSEPEHKVFCLEAAMKLYRGELLPEFYEEWSDQERRRWEEASLRTLKTLVQLHLKAERYEIALEFAQRLVKVDWTNEEVQQRLLILHTLTGGLEVALRHAGELQQQFRREGLSISAQTMNVIQQIERRAAGENRAEPELNAWMQLVETAPANPSALVRSRQLEPTGGAVPLESAFYIRRLTDEAFQQAIARRDSIVLVKGPRQTGKTSLLARGLHYARSHDAQIVYTDFNLFSESQLENADMFLDALADAISDQLDLPPPASARAPLPDPNSRFDRFLRREVLKDLPNALVWGMDGVDRLFRCPYGESIFALMRSWHESRSTRPDGPWQRLTLVISIATEPYLYVRNINQSPFNVGTRLEVDDFAPIEVADLNQQYDAPLHSEAELLQYVALLGGHPFLTHQGLHEMRRANTTLAELTERADDTAWIFGAHLRSIYGLLEQEQEMAEAAIAVFTGKPGTTHDCFDRLRSAGVLRGTSIEQARPRCLLYSRYLLPRLKERFSA
jgi:DNA-binding SARP family transcriptional activator